MQVHQGIAEKEKPLLIPAVLQTGQSGPGLRAYAGPAAHHGFQGRVPFEPVGVLLFLITKAI